MNELCARDRPLRVAHLIHGLAHGGAERVLLDLAEAAPGAGIEMSVLSMMPTDGYQYPEDLRARGVAVATLQLHSRWDLRALTAAVAALQSQAPDVLHAHLKHADLVGAYASRRLDVPLVSTLHLIEDAPGLLGRGKRLLAAQGRRRVAARTIAVSEAVRQWYLAAFRVDPARVVTIPNGVLAGTATSSEERRLLRSELGVEPETVMMTMVGVMRAGKGHVTAIAILRHLPSELKICLVLVGDGPLRGDLERAAAADVSTGRVVFTGYRTDVSALLQASDVQLSVSEFDALPTVLIEGLAAGTPAVAFSVGGVPEIVTESTGRLVPPGDVEAFATAVGELLTDPDLRARLGAAGRVRFDQEFDATIWAGRLRRLYADVLDEKAHTLFLARHNPDGRERGERR